MGNNRNVYGGQFFSPDERQICTIGTGYLANYMAGGQGKRAGATLTNKRVYFSGTVYTFINGRFSALNRRQIINTRDITGTGYDFYRPIGWIIAAVLSALAGLVVAFSIYPALLIVGAILCIIFIIIYSNQRMTLIFIEYAGGVGGIIAFDIRWIQKREQDDFMRSIHLVKDNLYKNAAEAQGFVSTKNSGAGSFTVDEIPDL